MDTVYMLIKHDTYKHMMGEKISRSNFYINFKQQHQLSWQNAPQKNNYGQWPYVVIKTERSERARRALSRSEVFTQI